MSMKKRDVIVSVRKLSETVQRQKGIMSPDSDVRGQRELLRTIAENQGISGVELALKMNLSAPVISEKLFNLEMEGMIYRERDQRDRRRTHIYLTNDGTMALEHRNICEKRFEEYIREYLGEEKCGIFCDLCEQIVLGLEKWMEAELDDKAAPI